ncbi:MAG: nucleotide exchange factor GrpE [Candidatus Eremiobacteraeota bacterium]|nr:nucleotide exchange factor GrpE [Candidatus Eremiobacteraeota bacterium]
MADNNDSDSPSGAAVPGIEQAPADGQASADGATSLQSQLDKARGQTQEQRDLYLRALADLDNYKKRTERLIREQSDAGRRALLSRILTVLDSLERAAAYRQQGVPAQQLVDGLLATVKQFHSLLEAEGVRPIELTGKTFDPKVSEAVATRVEPGAPVNTVVDQARKGYMIGDDLLRPAQVIVAKESE